MQDAKRLAVLWDGDLVGFLSPKREGKVVFSYAPEWLETHNTPISLSLPCGKAAFNAQVSSAFFGNLLPEGEMYRDICRDARLDEADIYNFLRMFGQECAGALVIAPEGEYSSTPYLYQDITESLEAILAKQHGMPTSSLIAQSKVRLSIAGAQNKLPVLYKEGRFFVPEEASFAPTNAILKPATARFADLHKNELFCMELARIAGLPVPEAQILQIGKYEVYLVSRYDRVATKSGIARIHQEDFCQALGTSRLKKYEENGGPGFAACTPVLLHPLMADALVAREKFIQCAFFNYAIGNCDAHGKNFSLLYQPHRAPENNTERVQLAPFYDLVSTRVYPDLDQKFAMAIGKTFRFDKIAAHSWKQLAADMQIRAERLFALMGAFSLQLMPEVETLAEKHEAQYGASPIYESLVRITMEGLHRLVQCAEDRD